MEDSYDNLLTELRHVETQIAQRLGYIESKLERCVVAEDHAKGCITWRHAISTSIAIVMLLGLAFGFAVNRNSAKVDQHAMADKHPGAILRTEWVAVRNERERQLELLETALNELRSSMHKAIIELRREVQQNRVLFFQKGTTRREP